MPPARPRVLADDSRSETSSTITNLKERANTGAGISKNKKTLINGTNNINPNLKTAAVNGALAASAAAAAVVETGIEAELPHTDWSSLPVNVLHSYRSAYKLQVPSSYTQPHADLLYKSSDVAQRAPSVVLVRRKLRDLKAHRKKMLQLNGGTHVTTNGVNKNNKTMKARNNGKDNSDTASRDGRRKGSLVERFDDPSNTTIAQSIEQDAMSMTADSDSASSLSQYQISSLLNQEHPESTIIGSNPSSHLANSIRKHFNAQQLNEAETIARFTYVVRQGGSAISTKRKIVLPNTTAAQVNSIIGGIHAGSNMTANGTGQIIAPGTSSLLFTTGSSNTGIGSGLSGSKLSTASSGSGSGAVLPTSGLGGGHVRVEGSSGDGNGWVMGHNGRQVRTSDSGGGGTFRLRFRP